MKDISKNFVLSILCKIVLMITGFTVQRAILHEFGSDINGLTTTVSQILSYMSLLEAGLGMASIQALYKPLAQNDKNGINSILSASNSQYVKTGMMFLVGLIGASFLVPLIVTGDIPVIVMGILTFLIGCSNVVSYIFMGKYTVLLTADKKLYAINTADITATILSCFFRLLAIRFIGEIIIVQVVQLASIVLKVLLIRIYVKKKYPWVSYKVNPNYQAISKRWSVLIHNIASMIVNHTAVIILSITETLKMVSVYGVYNYVVSNIYALMNAGFCQAPVAIFGRWYQQDRKKFAQYYDIFHGIFDAILNSVLFTTLVMMLPFVEIYTSGIQDVDYMDPLLAILFVITAYMNIVRLPSIMAINAVGAFKETQKGAIIEAIINLGASLALAVKFGIYGLLMGGIVSYCFRTIDLIYYADTKVVGRSIIAHFIKISINVFCGIGVSLILVPLTADSGRSWISWIQSAFGVFIVMAIIFIVLNGLINFKAMKQGVLSHKKNKT